MPIDHAQLLLYMKKLNYKVDEKGMCFGFAGMGMHAILTNDIPTYNQRLALLEKIPLDKLAKRIAVIKEKIKNKQKRDQLRDKEKIILTIPAFFDGVIIYQNDDFYPEIFPVSAQPKEQNYEEIFPRSLPKALVIEEEVLSENNKTVISEVVNLAKATTFTGIYNVSNLNKLFTIMRETYTENRDPICFILGSSNHFISVGYDPKIAAWLWIEAGPALIIKTDKEIASKVGLSFSLNQITTFCTEIYVTKERVLQVKNYLNACKQHESWQVLHQITEENMQKTDSYNTSWLYIASACGDEETIRLLLKKGANPNHTLDNGLTPLFIAAQHDLVDTVKLLLKEGANPNQAQNDGVTPVFIAAQNGHVKIVELLLEKSANPNQVLKDGLTPLFLAAQNGHVKIVELLLEKGANPNQARNDGVTPISMASQCGHDAIVKLLTDTINVLRIDSCINTITNSCITFFKSLMPMPLNDIDAYPYNRPRVRL
jgi:hypothetical protein